MALPTIQDLENLFPQLTNQARGISNKSKNGRKITERELGDAISSLLTKTKSVNAKQTKQTAVASGDTELLAQTEALEALVQGGVLDRMEEFLKGDLKAGQTDDLIDQFNALNDVITNVTEQSPIAISRMIRAQVSTLRSGKTSATRKASAVQNFQKISGKELTSKDLEQLIDSIEDGTEDLDRLIEQMQMTADQNDRMVEADNELGMSLKDLIAGVESGLIEQDALAASVSDLVPLLEESSIASDSMIEQLTNDPSLEVLKDLLQAVEGQDIGNIEKEKRKDLNLKEDKSFGDKVSNLTPDVVKNAAETGKGFIFNLLKAGLVLALLGSTGVLSVIGKILVRVGNLALNYIKETVAPKIRELLDSALGIVGDRLSSIGGFAGDQKEEVGNIVEFFFDKMRTKLELIGELMSLAFRKAIAKINPFSGSLPIRSARVDASQEAVQQGRYVVFKDENGVSHLLDFEGTRKLSDISQDQALDFIRNKGAIDRRIPANVGNFGGDFLREIDEKRLRNSQAALAEQVAEGRGLNFEGIQDDTKTVKVIAVDDLPKISEPLGGVNSVTLNELSSLSQGLGGSRGEVGRGNLGGPSSLQSLTRSGVSSRLSSGGSQRLPPSISALGRETEILNVNPGAQ